MFDCRPDIRTDRGDVFVDSFFLVADDKDHYSRQGHSPCYPVLLSGSDGGSISVGLRFLGPRRRGRARARAGAFRASSTVAGLPRRAGPEAGSRGL